MPFAPIMMADKASDLFKEVSGTEHACKFMTIILECTEWTKEHCPAVVHVDGTARPQMVTKETNPSMHCRAAVSMAREQQTTVEGSTQRLITRVGVHSGPMLVGNLGSSQRFDYTAIGDTINLAARLESLNKSMGTRVLVSGETLERAGDDLVVRYLGRVRVVGRDDPIELHELLGCKGDEIRLDAPTIARFESAVAAYAAGRLEEAAGGFNAVHTFCGGNDGPARLYLERIEQARKSPAGGTWDGVVNFTKK